VQQHVACQEGPQLRAAKSPATVIAYGGAAGGGKSFFQAWRAAKHYKVKGYSSALFRRVSTELTGSGSLFDECQGFYPSLGAESTTRPLEFTWSNPFSRVEFRHLQHEGDERSHKSKQYAYIGFDEATDFTGAQFTFMLSRLRTTCGVKTQFGLTTNPDPDSYLRTWVDWWIAKDGFPYPERIGKIRYFVRIKDEVVWASSREELAKYVDNPEHDIMSFTFIPSRVQDNKILMEKDPSYLGKLRSLPEVERQRFELGNWNAREAAGDFFQMQWFKQWGRTKLERALMLQDGPGSAIAYSIRWWDLAGTPVKDGLVPGIDRPIDFKAREPGSSSKDPDWTFGVRLDVTKDGRIIVGDVVAYRDTPGAIQAAIIQQAQEDGPKCTVGLWQDPGQAAIDQMERYKAALEAHANVEVMVASKNKTEYARAPSRAAYAGGLHYVVAPWNDKFFNQLQAYPTKGVHDDAVDALSGAYDWIKRNPGGTGAYVSANRPLVQAATPREMQMYANPKEQDRLQVRARGATNRFGHRTL